MRSNLPTLTPQENATEWEWIEEQFDWRPPRPCWCGRFDWSMQVPIKPENRLRYPADWPLRRETILRRAMWRCEHTGCEALHRDVGYWLRDKFVPMDRAMRDAGAKRGDVIPCSDGSTIKLIMIVLTIAHLDHQPENCHPDNLRALCQRHHLAHDAQHHKQTAYATRKAKANTPDLFGEAT